MQTDPMMKELLDQALGQMESENNENSYIEQMNFRKEITGAYFHTFAEGPGRIVLDHLFQTCVLSPTVVENESPKEDGIREGKKRVVLLILELMHRARTGDMNAS